MRILLRLRDAQLRFARGAYDLAQDVQQLLRREDERRRIGDVVLRQGDVINLRPCLPFKAVEILQQESLGNLAGPIGAEVEKENGVAIANALFVRVRENERRQEFIGLSAFVLGANGFGRRHLATLAPAKHDRVPGFLCPVPAPIPIHCEITADHRGELRATVR